MADKKESIQLENKTLLCVECANLFVFTAGEQRFYHSKGLALPKRCAQCRLAGLSGAKKRIFDRWAKQILGGKEHV